ncbi:MAG: hypothetical protein PHS44_06795 [Candidatus Dojkabacteria bacterium]|nr:hypothetical protein [Candidatus Dojkabacteria bacterium]
MSKSERKIEVLVVDYLDNPKKKLSSFQWQFINNSLSQPDIQRVKELGIELYEETECIDERVAAQSLLLGKIRIERNLPGGGFDFLTKEQMQQILLECKGQVILDPHRMCGWGKIRLDYYLDYRDEIKKPIEGTTMYFPKRQVFKNGIHYVCSLIKDTFTDVNFLNSVMRSVKLQR